MVYCLPKLQFSIHTYILSKRPTCEIDIFKDMIRFADFLVVFSAALVIWLISDYGLISQLHLFMRFRRIQSG